MKRSNCLLLAVVNLEHSHQFGNLQDIAQTLAQSGQLDFGAAARAEEYTPTRVPRPPLSI